MGAHVPSGTEWVSPTMFRLSLHTRKTLISSVLDGNSLTVNQKVNLTTQARIKTSSNVLMIKQNVTRNSARKICNKFIDSKSDDVVGTFSIIDQCIRRHIVPSNIQREENGKPFLLYFSLGMGSTMQIVISTRDALLKYQLYGRHLISDSRWSGPADKKICHTTALIKNDNGHFSSVVASLSSCESADTASIMLEALNKNRPCSSSCTHKLVQIACPNLNTICWARNCTDDCGNMLNKTMEPLVTIDKDSSAARGFNKKVSVDIFHHKKAFSERLRILGIPSGVVSATINLLHNITLR